MLDELAERTDHEITLFSKYSIPPVSSPKAGLSSYVPIDIQFDCDEKSAGSHEDDPLSISVTNQDMSIAEGVTAEQEVQTWLLGLVMQPSKGLLTIQPSLIIIASLKK